MAPEPVQLTPVVLNPDETLSDFRPRVHDPKDVSSAPESVSDPQAKKTPRKRTPRKQAAPATVAAESSSTSEAPSDG